MIEERGRAHFEGRQRTKDPAPVCVCGRGRASDGKISAEANGIRTNLADACLRCGRPPRHIEAKLSGRLASACALRSECHSHTRDAHYAGSPVTTWTALVRVVSGAGVPDGPPRCAKRTSTIRTEWTRPASDWNWMDDSTSCGRGLVFGLFTPLPLVPGTLLAALLYSGPVRDPSKLFDRERPRHFVRASTSEHRTRHIHRMRVHVSLSSLSLSLLSLFLTVLSRACNTSRVVDHTHDES